MVEMLSTVVTGLRAMPVRGIDFYRIFGLPSQITPFIREYATFYYDAWHLNQMLNSSFKVQDYFIFVRKQDCSYYYMSPKRPDSKP